MAPVPVISTRTTTASKTAGCGALNFEATSSTLGSGVAVQHTVTWEIDLSPAGFTYTTADPRPGATQGDSVSLIDGSWQGWSFSFPATHEGTYRVKLTLTDADGVSASTTTTVSVGADANTVAYLDGNATGANDGTSPEDAYTSWDTAKSWVFSGSNRTLIVAGSQVYTQASNPNFSTYISNNRIAWDGVGSKPIVEINGNTLIRMGKFGSTGLTLSENMTIDGLLVRSTAGNGRFIDISDDAILDLVIMNSGFDTVGGLMRSFVEYNAQGSDRILLLNNDTTSGADRYSGLFGDFDLFHAVGNIFGPTVTERPNRIIGANTIGAFLFNKVRTPMKDCIALQYGKYITINRNLLDIYDDVQNASNCIYINYNNGYSLHTTVSENYVLVSSGQARAMGGLKTVTTAPIVSGMDIMVRGNVFESTGTSNLAANCEVTTFDRAFFVGNTVIGNANTITASLLSFTSSTEGIILNNVFDYTGPAHASIFNDRLMGLTLPTTASLSGNDLDPGLSNANGSKYWSVNGTTMTTATVNGLSFASGNNEDSISIDADHLPSPHNAGTNPAGMLWDYYGNSMVPAASGFRGAVQEVPTSPSVPVIAANRIRSRIRRR